MRNFFIKNAGYKKMNYIESKSINISLRHKRMERKFYFHKIIRIIQALIIFVFILFLCFFSLKKILKLSKKINLKLNNYLSSYNINYYYRNLSLNTTCQNYKIFDIEPDELKLYFDYMDKARLGIFLNKKNLKNIQNPKISIVISVFNREDYIFSTIRSVQNQKFSEIEILIIDDHSTDSTVKYVKEMQKQDPRIKLFMNKKNMGTLYSKSIGVLNAKGEYIYSLDSDDMLLKEDYLSIIYEEGIGASFDFVQCDAIYLDEIKKVIYKKTPNWMVLWSKLIKKKTYQKAVYKLGKEVLNNKVVVLDDDVIGLFLFYSGSRKKLNLTGVCHFTHLGPHVYFNQFMNSENTKRYCLNMISTIDAFYKLKKYFYGDFLFKYLYVGRGACNKYSNLTEAQKIITEFIRHNSTKK